MHLLLLFTAALVLSSVLAHYVRNAALKHGWTCDRVRRRDVHALPIPRLGGVAISTTFLVVTIAYMAFCSIRRTPTGFGTQITFAVLAPAMLVFLLGLIDDFRSIAPQVKFGVQAIAALLLYAGGIKISYVPLVAGYQQLHSIVSLVLTVFWVLLISNAFNLIDGLDGLSSGSALFSTLVVFVVSLFSGNAFVAVITITLAGAILGFLRYNFNPATIFLGDCGSLFLGFMLSAVSLAGAQKSTTLVAVAIPIVSFGLPLLDTFLSVVRRFLSGQPLFIADREHIHHKLLKRGLTHRQAVVLLYGVSAAMGLASLLLLYPRGSSTGIVLAILGAGIWFGVQHLGYPEFAELGRAAKRTVDQRQIIVNNLAIRRATEELSSAGDFRSICTILESAFVANEFDSFDLVFQPAGTHNDVPTPFTRAFNGHYRFEWRKAGGIDPEALQWQLSLVLKGSSFRTASFTVHRKNASRNLLFDVNLLAGDFQIALSQALQAALQARQSVALLAGMASVRSSMTSAVAITQS